MPEHPPPATTIDAPVTGSPVGAAPVMQKQRIVSLDVLRGVAVLGILAMNIWTFALPSAAYMNPTAFGELDPPNLLAWYITHVFFDMKMMTIFSMLFGAGIVLFTERAEQKTGRSAGVHYRRTGWLILFGLLHAHLLWHGDILYTYGMCGLILYLFRRFTPFWLVFLGVISLLIMPAISLLSHWSVQFWPPEQITEMANQWSGGGGTAEHELRIFSEGPWIEQQMFRSTFALMFQTFMLAFLFGWRVCGAMLIGMALYKLGVFSAARSTAFYFIMLALSLLIGLPLVIFGVHQQFAHDWAFPYAQFLGLNYNYFGSLFLALAWVAVVMLLCRADLRVLLRPLAAAGQMALTNYLTQTIMCVIIFYHYGFGLFGSLERWQLPMVVLSIWALQLIWSPIWLHFFRFGPFEWFWRSLTYWKLQPLIRR